jgi:hypothetical protein
VQETDALPNRSLEASTSEERKMINMSVFNMNERIISDYFIKPLNDQMKQGVVNSLRLSLGATRNNLSI